MGKMGGGLDVASPGRGWGAGWIAGPTHTGQEGWCRRRGVVCIFAPVELIMLISDGAKDGLSFWGGFW